MMKEILKRTFAGVGLGGLLTFIALTILLVLHIESTVGEIWKHMLGSILMGVYFSLASFIFQHEAWSPLIKTIIHFSLSISFYYLVALSVGWVPFDVLSILFNSLIFIAIYMIFWASYYLYYKKIESSLNKDLESRN